jgi:hypothetical protein
MPNASGLGSNSVRTASTSKPFQSPSARNTAAAESLVIAPLLSPKHAMTNHTCHERLPKFPEDPNKRKRSDNSLGT